jgi:hypothetical protein
LDNLLTFKMVWPDLSPRNANVWMQESNPFLEGAAADKVDGYIPVDIAFSGVDPKLLWAVIDTMRYLQSAMNGTETNQEWRARTPHDTGDYGGGVEQQLFTGLFPSEGSALADADAQDCWWGRGSCRVVRQK